MTKVKLHDSWRFACPDCTEAKNFIDENIADYGQFFTSKRILTLGSLAVGLAIGVSLVSILLDRFIDNIRITPELYVLFYGLPYGIFLLFYYIDWVSHNHRYRVAVFKVVGYQAIWPTILEVIEENEGKLCLPNEPLRADYIEIVEHPVFNDSHLDNIIIETVPEKPQTKPIACIKQIEAKPDLPEEEIVDSVEMFIRKWKTKGVSSV